MIELLELSTANMALVALVFMAGFAAGFAGGLFGIGGGIVMTPTLYAVFQLLGVAEGPSLKTAIGTSLGVIIITSIRSLMTHHRAGHVDMIVLRAWAPWIALGAIFGGLAVRRAPVELLTIVFAGGALLFAWRRLTPRIHHTGDAPDHLLRRIFKIPVAFGTGLFSSLMGLGGGAIGVLVMTASGRSIHQAVATSAGFGVAVAAPGVAGFIYSGRGLAGLPLGSIGYFNGPAFIAMALTAAIAAPLGAKLAHRTSANLLSKLFGLLVLIASIALLLDVFAG